jgi:hypothetical protein
MQAIKLGPDGTPTWMPPLLLPPLSSNKSKHPNLRTNLGYISHKCTLTLNLSSLTRSPSGELLKGKDL